MTDDAATLYKAIEYIINKLNLNEQTKEIIATNSVEEKTDKRRIIKGVRGLKEYLGIGLTKAQEILNSQILQQKGIAYRVGKDWRINSEKLDRLIADDPYIFSGKLQKVLIC